MKKLAALIILFVGAYTVSAQTNFEEQAGIIKSVSENMERGILISEEGIELEFINPEKITLFPGDEVLYDGLINERRGVWRMANNTNIPDVVKVKVKLPWIKDTE